jgi:hypothetical protein
VPVEAGADPVPVEVEPEALGVANGCGTVAPEEVGFGAADDAAAGAGVVVDAASGAGLAAGAALARPDGEAAGLVRLGDAALAVGRVLAPAWLAGWDWFAPCGCDLGLTVTGAGPGLETAAGADAAVPDVADEEPPEVAEASYRYRLYWRIKLMSADP